MMRRVWSTQRPSAARVVGIAAATSITIILALSGATASAQQHRAEQDREITYWLLEPATHSFRISHDFTVDTAGQTHVHNFVRAGSEVSEPTFYDLNTGTTLVSEVTTGRAVNAAGTYSSTLEDDAIVIEAALTEPVRPGHSVRIRVVETYTDPVGYSMDGDQLVWERTLGRPRNVVILPAGWELTSLSVPARIALDDEDRVVLTFVNPRPDSLRVLIHARPR